MVFFLDIIIAPFERLAVTIIGSISGVRPTATDMAKMQAHLGNALVESRSCTMSSHALGYCTKIGMVARRKDYALGRTTYHIRAHKADVVQVNNTARVLALS